MIEINEKLSNQISRQNDGICVEEEEQRLCRVASAYAYTEGAFAVLSCLRTDISHIYFGKVAEKLGFDSSVTYQRVDSVWEEEIIEHIHPDDWVEKNLQELIFLHQASIQTQSPALQADPYPWYLENTLRMRDRQGHWYPVRHRIFYFQSQGKPGISYALCIYNLTDKLTQTAFLRNTSTGECRRIRTEDYSRLLSAREKDVLICIRQGLASKQIADRLKISKNTVDRHRQNIIMKLQVSNTTEACHKAKVLGLID